MKKFSQFLEDANQPPTPEEEDARNKSGHLGWKYDDVEHHGTDEDEDGDEDQKQSNNSVQEAMVGEPGASSWASINKPHGGLKNPKGGIPKYWKPGGMGAGSSNDKDKHLALPSRPPHEPEKPYHSDHPDQLGLFKEKKKKTKADPNVIHSISSSDIIQHHEHDDVVKEFGVHGKSLNYSQRKTIEEYKGGLDINHHLRQTKGKSPGVDRDHNRNMNKITSHKTTQPLTLYRGVHDQDFLDLPVGHKFTDHGYTGTSIKPHIAGTFGIKHGLANGEDTNYGGHIFRIHAPAGTKAHYLDMHHNSYSNEQEVNLNRGTKFKIMKRSKTETGQHVIDLHVVGQRKDKVKKNV